MYMYILNNLNNLYLRVSGKHSYFIIETVHKSIIGTIKRVAHVHQDTENSSQPRTHLMITQRDTISQEVVNVFRRRPKVIKNVKVRNKVSRDTKRGRRSTNRD